MTTSTISLLIINPNSTKSMTDRLEPVVNGLGYPGIVFAFFTNPSGPPSIDDDVTARQSAESCLPHILLLTDRHDGFLVACYSVHPLVEMLKQCTRKPVIGIFGASIIASMQLIRAQETFGIVSTGKLWEKLLTDGVHNTFGTATSDSSTSETLICKRFAAVKTTGLNATELHEVSEEELEGRMKDATRRLIESSSTRIGAICLGCAGMANLESYVREACIEQMGEDGTTVRIIDGVKAGVGLLIGFIRGHF